MVLAVVAATVVHLHDRFGINHVSGAQLALTRHFQTGRLDPAFFDPPVIGGTRFSPVPTLIHAGVDLGVDDLFVSGRLMTAAFGLASGGLVFWICRTYGVNRRWAAIAGAVMLATPEIFTVSTSIRQDVVALGFVLGSFALARSAPSRIALVLAGVCSSLAVFSKPTAGWVIPVIVVMLWSNRAALGWYLGAGAVSGFGAFWLIMALSDGRYLDTLRLLFAGSTSLESTLLAPERAFRAVLRSAPIILVGFAAWFSNRRVRHRELDVAAVVLTVLVVVLFRDSGVGANHLVDQAAFATILLAVGVGAPAHDGGARRMAGLLAVALLILGWMGAVDALQLTGPGAPPIRVARNLVPDDSRVLSEDPGVVVGMGQVPELLDSYMVQRLPGESGELARNYLVEQIAGGAYDRIVLLDRLEVGGRFANTNHFTPEIGRAIEERYILLGQADGFWVYAPG
jgi:hypothetical protein